MCNKMSDVRLSNNASPTLELGAGARVVMGLGALVVDGPGASRPPVCRNLFGSSDRRDLEDFQRERRAQMAEEQRRFAERWSYDVVADRPLEGTGATGGLEWEEVSDAPDFYSRAPRGERRPRPEDCTNGNHHNNNHRGGAGDDRGRSSSSSSSSPGERSPCRGGGGGDSPRDGGSSPRRRRQRAAGPCSGDSPRKRLRCEDDEDDEDDQSNCTRSQTLTSVEETPSKADSREQLG